MSARYEASFGPSWIWKNFNSWDRIECAPFIKTNMIELADHGCQVTVDHMVPKFDNFGKSRPKIRLHTTYGTMRLHTHSCHLLDEHKLIDLLKSKTTWIGKNRRGPELNMLSDYVEPTVDQIKRFVLANEHRVLEWMNDARYQKLKDYIVDDDEPVDIDNIIDLAEYLENKAADNHTDVEQELERLFG